MIGGPRPWSGTNTLTAQVYCPWSAKEVVVRYLTADGQTPIGVVGCSERDCRMQCLSGEAPPAPPIAARSADEGWSSEGTV